MFSFQIVHVWVVFLHFKLWVAAFAFPNLALEGLINTSVLECWRVDSRLCDSNVILHCISIMFSVVIFDCQKQYKTYM